MELPYQEDINDQLFSVITDQRVTVYRIPRSPTPEFQEEWTKVRNKNSPQKQPVHDISVSIKRTGRHFNKAFAQLARNAYAQFRE